MELKAFGTDGDGASGGSQPYIWKFGSGHDDDDTIIDSVGTVTPDLPSPIRTPLVDNDKLMY